MTSTSDKQLFTYRYYIALHITILLAIHTTCYPTGGSWNGNIFSSSPSSSSSSFSSSSLSSVSPSSSSSLSSPSSSDSSSFYILPSGLSLHSSSSSLLVSSPNQITKRASDDISGSSVGCTPGNPLRDRCERCSKASRSREAYAKCCQGVEQVLTFCEALLNYTFPGRPRKLSRSFHPRWWYLP